MRLAVIIAIRDRAASIEESLCALGELRRHGHRVVVVDGGSRDDSIARASRFADRVIAAPAGWSRQMNAGCSTPEAEEADALVFLPESVRLPPQADRAIARALSNSPSPWGRFDIEYRRPAGGDARAWRLAAALSNACSRITGICTREQAMFVSRAAFLALDGFAACGDAADTDFSRRARALGAPIVLHERARVHGAEHETAGLLRAIARRERSRLAAALGLVPDAPREHFRHES